MEENITTDIKPGWKIIFECKEIRFSGYVRKVNENKTLECSVYQINDVTLGRYYIFTNVHRDESLSSADPRRRK